MEVLSDQRTNFSPHLVNYVYSIISNTYRNIQYVQTILPAANAELTLTSIGYIRHNTINNENKSFLIIVVGRNA